METVVARESICGPRPPEPTFILHFCFFSRSTVDASTDFSSNCQTVRRRHKTLAVFSCISSLCLYVQKRGKIEKPVIENKLEIERPVIENKLLENKIVFY